MTKTTIQTEAENTEDALLLHEIAKLEKTIGSRQELRTPKATTEARQRGGS